MAYERVNGSIGLERLDYHAALVAERVSNMLKGPKTKQYTVDDFMPKWVSQVSEGGNSNGHNP